MHDRGKHELAAPHAELRLIGGRHRNGNRHVTTGDRARRPAGVAGTHAGAAASVRRKSGGGHRDSSKTARRHGVRRHERLHHRGTVAVTIVTAVVPHIGRDGGGAHLRLLPLLVLPVLLRLGAVYPGGITVHEKLLLLLPVSATTVVVVMVVHVYPARGHAVRVAASVTAFKVGDVAKAVVSPLHHHNLLVLLLKRLHAVVLLGHHVGGVVRRRKAWPTTHAAAALHVLVQLQLRLRLLLLAHVLQQKYARITRGRHGAGR